MNTIDSLAFMFIPIYLRLAGNVPPPPGMKKLDTGQSDILFLADVPPPPQGVKKFDTGQSDILLLADVPPPPEIEIGLNMNAIGKKSFQERSSSTFYQSTPLPLPLSDSIPEQETGKFQFQMDIWTRTPSTTPLQSKE